MKSELLKYKKIVYCFTLLIALIIFTIIIKYYFKPFFTIVIITFFSLPIENMLSRSNLFNNKVNALISIVIVNCLFFIIVIFIGNFIYGVVNSILKDFTDLTLSIQNTLETVSKLTNIKLNELGNNLLDGYGNMINSNFIKRGAAYTTDSLFAYFIGNIAVYFILVDKYDIVNHIKNFIPQSKIYLVKSKLEDINKVFKVEAALVLVTTIETMLGFMILNINNFIPLSILCGIFDILPYVGTIMIFLPLIFYKVIIREYIMAFGLTCLYILLVINRQILETKFISDRLAVHPLFIILSLYIGIKVFGVIGIFIGPLYAITAKEILTN